MKFRSPDHAVKEWYEAHRRALSVPGQSIGQSGRDYAPRCQNKKCKRKGHPMMMKGLPRCPRCSALWDYTESYTLAGQSHSGKGGRPPGRLLLAGDAAARLQAIENFGNGDGAIYVQWVLIESKSREAIAWDATKKNFYGRAWTLNDVRGAIRRSRRWLTAELEFRGLM